MFRSRLRGFGGRRLVCPEAIAMFCELLLELGLSRVRTWEGGRNGRLDSWEERTGAIGRCPMTGSALTITLADSVGRGRPIGLDCSFQPKFCQE